MHLFQGWTIVGYRGAPLPVAQALNNCLDAVDAVLFWDAGRQSFAWWYPGSPPGTNTLETLLPGMSLWVLANRDCLWQQP